MGAVLSVLRAIVDSVASLGVQSHQGVATTRGEGEVSTEEDSGTCPPPDTIDWSQLPETAIRLVALMAGKSGISFCASCHAFRAAQPPLRTLTIDPYRLGRRGEFGPKDEFCIVLGAARLSGANAVPEKYAKDTTHLFWNLNDYANNDDMQDYGKNLTSLHTLHIIKPPAPTANTLQDCFLQLVRATKETLRELSIHAGEDFKAAGAFVLLNEIGGEKLHSLSLALVPFGLVPPDNGTKGSEADTISLRRIALETCKNLCQPEAIKCHLHIPPWFPMFSPGGRRRRLNPRYLLWNDPWWRQEFLDQHTFLEKVKRAAIAFENPEGYRGPWCGLMGSCECSSDSE